ncbi:protein spinster homolog 1-like [Saccoglossus kowalevskii]|uniref:Protein spinster homolog 1-like n=1 Tax=Saccoglossus kowalevskii TaxID=10224 RepID=A0ABM0MGA9_SACKO|nr:PREDICTED: protein spinster homolog 1-like [Saccoglossus kowalevskii]
MSIYFDRDEDRINVQNMSASPATGVEADDPYDLSDDSDKAALLDHEHRDTDIQSNDPRDDKILTAIVTPGNTATSARAYVTVAILCFVNLLNYMDRFTVAGNLKDIQHFYSLTDAEAGALQTVFVCMYMVAAPVFGFLGDRYNRKIIMSFGIFMWTCFTLVGSFIPKQNVWIFFAMRGLVGIGEASYSTIAPTLIADLFVKGQRTRMLAVFYFAIPVGSGLGYVVGSEVAHAAGSWQWGLRITPVLGVVSLILIVGVLKEPQRGQSDTGHTVRATSYLQDLKALAGNHSYIWSCLGYVGVAWVAGCLSWWAPRYIQYAYALRGQSQDSVALVFGGITVVTGIIGVGLGAESARRLRKYNQKADAWVCAFGLMACSPFLYLALVFTRSSEAMTWVMIFLGETCLSLNWAVTSDILLYVVTPTRRATANAFQMLASHLLGDATSPYIVGQISDFIRHGEQDTAFTQFYSLQYALYLNCFIAVLGGGCYLAVSLYIVYDKAKAEHDTKDLEEKSTSQPDQVTI